MNEYSKRSQRYLVLCLRIPLWAIAFLAETGVLINYFSREAPKEAAILRQVGASEAMVLTAAIFVLAYAASSVLETFQAVYSE